MASNLVDLTALLKLKSFSFGIKSRSPAEASGIHKSVRKGASPDFLDYKEYSEGDEPKRIDWRLYGRQDRLYVRKFEEEANLAWCILIDATGSMGFGSADGTKLDYAKRLSATLSYLLLKQGDSVALADFSGKGDVEITPPGAGTSHIHRITARLSSITAEGRIPITDTLVQVIERIRRAKAFVVVSDFLYEESEIAESLKRLRAAGKAVFFIQTLDAEELDFNFEGTVEFEDMEDGGKILVDADAVREGYRKRVAKFTGNVKSLCHESGASYVLSPTNAPVEDALLRIAVK